MSLSRVPSEMEGWKVFSFVSIMALAAQIVVLSVLLNYTVNISSLGLEFAAVLVIVVLAIILRSSQPRQDAIRSSRDVTNVCGDKPTRELMKAVEQRGGVFCMYCQCPLPEDALYCRRCGKPQTAKPE